MCLSILNIKLLNDVSKKNDQEIPNCLDYSYQSRAAYNDPMSFPSLGILYRLPPQHI